MNIELITDVVQTISFIVFIALVALAVMRMTLRIIAYKFTGRSPSVILRRDMFLMTAFLLIFGSPLFITFFGLNDVFRDGVFRLGYTIVRNLVALASLTYWVWAEYFVIGNTDKEND